MAVRAKRDPLAGERVIWSLRLVRVLMEKAIRLTEASIYRRKRLLKEKKSGVRVRKNKGTRKAVRGRMNFRVWVASLSSVCLMVGLLYSS